MYPVVEHTRPNNAARNHSRSRAPHHRTQENARRELRQERAVFILRPTNVRIWHKAVFKVGPPKRVAQPKLGAYSAPSLLLVSSTHPARMPDGPAKKRERAMYLSLPPTRHDLTQGQKPEG